MIKRLLWLPVLLIGSAAVLGCSKQPEEDSCNIKTGGIYVEYEVTESNNTATARATFWVGDAPGGTYLTLGSCGDDIKVNGQALRHESGADHDYYESTVPVAGSYEFVFTRTDEDPYSSTVSTPPAIHITAPTEGASISRAESFDITWDNNGSGQLNLLIDGDCIKDFPSVNGEAIADTGSYTVNANGIEPFVSSDADKTCTANISLERSTNGALDPNLKGTITGYSGAGRSFTSTP